MASKEFLEERIRKATEQIEKKSNTIEKKNKLAQKKLNYLSDKYNIATLEGFNKYSRTGWTEAEHNDIYWTVCDIENLYDDIKRLEDTIKEKQVSLSKYQGLLDTVIEKENSRNVQVLIDFLEKWKSDCHDFYMGYLKDYYAEKETVHLLGAETEKYRWGTPEYETAKENYEKAAIKFRENCNGKFIEDENKPRWDRKVKVKDGKYEFIRPYMLSSINESETKLLKDLKEEANAKYDDIIERTNEIVGEITDASELRINAKGNLDGVIIGTRGKASVTTIGAGGYNIQCYHFRTLIHPFKECRKHTKEGR